MHAHVTSCIPVNHQPYLHLQIVHNKGSWLQVMTKRIIFFFLGGLGVEGWERAKGHWSRMLEIKKYTFPHNPSDVRFVLTQTQLSFPIILPMFVLF